LKVGTQNDHPGAITMLKPPYFSSSTGLLSVRSSLILLLGLLGGAAAGTLTYLAGEHWALAILAGLGGSSAVITFFDVVITPDQSTPNKSRSHKP
ncbi:MAG: hypothetical protein JO287_05315, partial [Pseudonocardiales bacterium]|nr:hypothetical protein [Pseudonocardiales bacterium]